MSTHSHAPQSQNENPLFARIAKVLDDLDFLKEHNQILSKSTENFRNEAFRQQLRELENAHRKGLEDKSDYYGLPLTLTEYETWYNLYEISASKNTEAYRLKAAELESYKTLKAIHNLRDSDATSKPDSNPTSQADTKINELLNRLLAPEGGDRLVRAQRDLLLDGVLSYLEIEVIGFLPYREQKAKHEALLEKMRECAKYIFSTTSAWNKRISILSAWSHDEIAKMWDEIVQLKNMAIQVHDSLNNNTMGWGTFRWAQTTDEKPRGFLALCLQPLVAKLESEINDCVEALDKSNLSSVTMTSGFQNILILKEIKKTFPSFVLSMTATNADHAFNRLKGKLPDILKHLREQLIKEVITKLPHKSLEDLMITLRDLVSGVQRIVRGLGEAPLDELEKLRSDIDIAQQHIGQMEEKHRKMSDALRESLVRPSNSKNTWNFKVFETLKGEAVGVIEAIRSKFPDATAMYQQAGQEFDCKSIQSLASMKEDIESLTKKLATSIETVRENLSSKKRTEVNPSICYKNAEKELKTIDMLVESISNDVKRTFGDSTIFEIPKEIMVSSVDIMVGGKYVSKCTGLEDHRSLVKELLEHATKWDKWWEDVTKEYSKVTEDGHYKAIQDWNQYARDLLASLPQWWKLPKDYPEEIIKSFAKLATKPELKPTNEIFDYIRGKDGLLDRAFIDLTEEPSSNGYNDESAVYDLYKKGKRLQCPVDAVGRTPSEKMLVDLWKYHSSSIHKAPDNVPSLTAALKLKQEPGLREPDSPEEFVEWIKSIVVKKMDEIFKECSKADYIATRFRGYVIALETDLEAKNRHPPAWWKRDQRTERNKRVKDLKELIALLENKSKSPKGHTS